MKKTGMWAIALVGFGAGCADAAGASASACEQMTNLAATAGTTLREAEILLLEAQQTVFDAREEAAQRHESLDAARGGPEAVRTRHQDPGRVAAAERRLAELEHGAEQADAALQSARHAVLLTLDEMTARRRESDLLETEAARLCGQPPAPAPHRSGRDDGVAQSGHDGPR